LRLRANILQIAEFFLDRRCRKVGKQELSESARNLLLQHPWPGNLRQLDHVITVAVALMPANQGLIETRYFPDDFVAQSIESNPSSPSCREPAPGTLDQAATDLIERTIQGCGGNVSAAARALKISRSTIYNRWRRL
jgi:sigma-54 dependent transcriptional regulator, acetoin dehydrogenase operon transcriptional activator AcoR